MARVVLLNGVGSVGKGSVARALQGLAARPLLHLQMDAFLEMLPERFWDHPDGMVFERGERDGRPCVAIRCGPVVERLLAGMRGAVAALADAGNDLIVDEVAERPAIEDYRRRLAGHDLTLVKVSAPLAIVEERERQRGDRLIGLARGQAALHEGIAYDLELGTGAATPEACARRLAAGLGL